MDHFVLLFLNHFEKPVVSYLAQKTNGIDPSLMIHFLNKVIWKVAYSFCQNEPLTSSFLGCSSFGNAAGYHVLPVDAANAHERSGCQFNCISARAEVTRCWKPYGFGRGCR